MKLSIITPSYNQVKYINKTIKSVLTQKGDFEIEYFVMDGDSNDNTVGILKKYDKEIASGRYKKFNQGIKFYWQSKKDKGQSDAINQGLKKATGDILAYINSDDTYIDNAFQKVADAFKKNPEKKWLTGYCNIINQDDKPIRSYIANYKNFWLRHYSYNKLLVLNFISQPSTFWKAEIFKKYGFFDEKLHYTMDYDYWLKIGKGNDPVVIASPLANFRIHNQSKGEASYVKQFKQDGETVRRYCKGHFFNLLHKFHNQLILFSYRIIK